MPVIPPLRWLLPNHPAKDVTQGQVAALVGGDVKRKLDDPKATNYKDTCCIRVSRALNAGGDPIPEGGGGLPNPYFKNKKIRTDKGADGWNYIYSVLDLRAYLTGRYGPPIKFGKLSQADLAAENVKGIILFPVWHADIWEGRTCNFHNRGFAEASVHEYLVYPSHGD